MNPATENAWLEIRFFVGTVIAFACFETILGIGYFLTIPQIAGTCATDTCKALAGNAMSLGKLFGPLWSYSVPLSISGWTLAGGFLLWRRETVKTWRDAGLTKDVHDLMTRMRGGKSRLILLQEMSTPKHRAELSERTGFDWKEVDRQLGLLRGYGLVTIVAESGSVKMYGLTEQGRILLKLMEGLSSGER